MGFLSPWFLAGLLGVGLPVFVHLLRRHRVTPTKFSSLKFFERRQESSLKQRRLDYLLLFALRAAFLVLLALAFMDPFVMRKDALAGGRAQVVVLAVDNSLSMRAAGRLERAKEEARAVLRGLGGQARVQVLEFASEVRFFGQPGQSRADAEAAIQAIQPTDSRGSLGDLARAMRSLAESSQSSLEVHVFSDFQSSGMPPGFGDLRLPEGTRLVPHRLATSQDANLAVESVNAPPQVFGNEKVAVEATFVNHSTAGTTVPVSLWLNGKQLARKQAVLGAGERSSLAFDPVEIPYGFHQGEVRVEAADALPADNRLLFAVVRTDPRPVLFVHDARDRRSPVYFRAALESEKQPAFLPETASAGDAAGRNLKKYAFVVLSDISGVDTRMEENLASYVRSGGALWVVVGPNAAALRKIPVAALEIEPGRLAERGAERFQSAANLDMAHPALAGTGDWARIKFFRSWPVTEGQGRVLARLADRSPLLVEREVGDGRVLVFCSTLDNVASDFPLQPQFVPFVQRAALYLSGAADAARLSTVDSYVDLRPAGQRGGALEVIDPDGQRAVSLEESTRIPSLKLGRAGYFEIRRANGRRELIAVNADRRESELLPMAGDVLELWQNTGQPVSASGVNQQTQERPSRLWWYVLLLAVLMFIVESFAGLRYLDSPREAV